MSTVQISLEQDEALAMALDDSQVDANEDEAFARALAASQVDHTPSKGHDQGFLKLSAELRNRVYLNAAIQHIRDLFLEGYNGHGLMYVNKQVRTEYFAIFHPIRKSLSAKFLKQAVPEEWIQLDPALILRHLEDLRNSTRVGNPYGGSIILMAEDCGREEQVRSHAAFEACAGRPPQLNYLGSKYGNQWYRGLIRFGEESITFDVASQWLYLYLLDKTGGLSQELRRVAVNWGR